MKSLNWIVINSTDVTLEEIDREKRKRDEEKEIEKERGKESKRL